MLSPARIVPAKLIIDAPFAIDINRRRIPGDPPSNSQRRWALPENWVIRTYPLEIRPFIVI